MQCNLPFADKIVCDRCGMDGLETSIEGKYYFECGSYKQTLEYGNKRFGNHRSELFSQSKPCAVIEMLRNDIESKSFDFLNKED